MHMRRLAERLAEVFSLHGHTTTLDAALEGRSGSLYTAPLLAEKDGHAVLVEVRGPEELVDADAVADLCQVARDAGADLAVLAHVEPATPDALAGTDGCAVLWDLGTLVRVLGSALVAEALEAPPPELPLQPGVAPPADELADLLEAPLRATPRPGPAVRPSTAPKEVPAPAPASGFLDGLEHPLLRPLLSLDLAQRRAKDRVFGVARAELHLRPVHVMEYEVDLLAEGSLRYETVTGRLVVDGTRPVAEPVESVEAATAAPEGEYTLNKRGLRIEAEKAEALATQWLCSQYTRLVEVEVQDEDQSFAYTEKRKVTPRPDHVRLRPLGIHYRPAWRLIGTNGHVDLDAVDGRPVDENLRTPNADIVMVD